MIKIEHPTGGDFLRTIPPFDDGVSLFWAVEGRGKRSVTLVSVYGQDGPYRDRPGLDRNAIALGGLLHITGHPDHPPVRPGVVIGDYLSALFNTVGILAALVERGRSGQGQGVEVALYESVLRVMEWTVAAYDRLGVVRERTGNRLPNSAPLDNYETADGRFVCIVAAGDVLFPRLCEAMGRTDLPADERFASLERRAANADAINGIVATWCRDRTAEDIEATLVEHDVPVSRIHPIDEIVADPHVRARGSIATVDDPQLGAIRQQGPVPRLDRTPLHVRAGAPMLGQHTEEVLRGLLGMGAADIEDLRSSRVI